MKTLSSLIIVFLSPLFCNADVTDWYKVKTDKNGNIYILGEYSGVITIGSATLGKLNDRYSVPNYSYFITKLTPNGSVVWVDSIQGITTNCYGDCAGYVGLAIDNDNNILISMSTNDSLVYRGISYYQPNIIKLDSSGNLLWTKRIRESNLAETDIAIDSKNNIYYVSVFQNSISCDTIKIISCDSTSQKSCVAKLSTNGNIKWIREIASPISGHTISLQTCWFITADSNGNSYIGGNTSHTISLGNDKFSGPGFYPFLAKLDSNGNPGFLKAYANSSPFGSTNSQLVDGAVSKNQKLYTCGTFRDTVFVAPSSIVLTSRNSNTPYIASTNTTNGNAIWFQYNQNLSYGGLENHCYSISSDDKDNILAIGDMDNYIQFYSSINGLTTLTSSLSNTYFAKFDSSGNFQCYKSDSSTFISGAVFESNYYTVGISNVKRVGDIVYSSVTLVKWDIDNCIPIWRNHFNQAVITLNIPINNNVQSGIFLYPNPSIAGVFYIKDTYSIIKKIQIYSAIGQEVMFKTGNNSIDISQLPKGIYIYRVIYNDNTTQNGKIIYK